MCTDTDGKQRTVGRQVLIYPHRMGVKTELKSLQPRAVHRRCGEA